MAEVEVIDISPFTIPEKHNEESRNEVLKAWNNAFMTLGFAVIIGHNVPLENITTMQSDARKFFEQTSTVKMKICLNSGYGNGGYVPIGIESVARSRETPNYEPPDFVESIEFLEGAQGNDIVPKSPDSLQNTVQNYWKQMQNLLAISMEISALSLGLPRDYFAPYHTKPECSLRLAYYPAQDKVKPEPNQIRYGAHTDYTGFTFLRPDVEVGGLEIIDPKTSSWIPVNPKGNVFIVNAGDLLQQWTNDHWISNLHRVVNPPEDISHKARLSIVYFTGPNNDAVISPLDKFCTTDKPAKYKPVVSGQYLKAKFNVTTV